MRPADGAKPLDLGILRKALMDRRTWCGLALVVKRQNESSHFEIEADDNGNPVDVLVEIDLMPEGIPVTARLGCFGGAVGMWRIPPVGTEVAWIAPHGQLASDVLIVGALSTGGVPAALDADTFVIVNPKKVIVTSRDDKVYLGSMDGTGTKPVAYKDGQVDLGTFVFVPGSGGASLTWTPPGGGAPVGITTGSDLTGKITDGAATAEVKP